MGFHFVDGTDDDGTHRRLDGIRYFDSSYGSEIEQIPNPRTRLNIQPIEAAIKVVQKTLSLPLRRVERQSDIGRPEFEQCPKNLFGLKQVFLCFRRVCRGSLRTNSALVYGKSTRRGNVDHDAVFVQQYGRLNLLEEKVEMSQRCGKGVKCIEMHRPARLAASHRRQDIDAEIPFSNPE